MTGMDDLLTAKVFDVRNAPLADMPRDAGLMLERLMRKGPTQPPVAAFQASI